MITKEEVDQITEKISNLSFKVQKIASAAKRIPTDDDHVEIIYSNYENRGHSANRCTRIPDREKCHFVAEWVTLN